MRRLLLDLATAGRLGYTTAVQDRTVLDAVRHAVGGTG